MTPEYSADRLLQAVNESDLGHLFLFPVHTIDGGYIMPIQEKEAFRDVIFPKLYA